MGSNRYVADSWYFGAGDWLRFSGVRHYASRFQEKVDDVFLTSGLK